MLKLIGAFLVGFFISMQASASTWIEVSLTDESTYHIDLDRVQRTSEYGKSYFKVWVKETIYNDITKDGLTVGDYSLFLYHVDCQAQALGAKSYVSYKKNGKKINSKYFDYVKMRDAVPNSIGDSIVTYTCASI